MCIGLSNININDGKIVTVHKTPIITPFAITIPISIPKLKSIVQSAKNPATVVVELPIIDTNVFCIAFDMASILSEFFPNSSSYL